MSVEKILDNYVKETGISKIINSYKYDLELVDSIYKYDKNEIIYNNNNKENFIKLSKNKYLSYDFILKNINKLDIDNVCKYQRLHYNFIDELVEKYNVKVNWDFISIHQKITNINFLEKYKYKLNWRYISIYRPLTEEIILKFKDYLDMVSLCTFQKLSFNFIKDNINNLPLDILKKYQPEEYIIKICPELYL